MVATSFLVVERICKDIYYVESKGILNPSVPALNENTPCHVFGSELLHQRLAHGRETVIAHSVEVHNLKDAILSLQRVV